MYETKDKEIDGFKVTVTQWPARKAFKKKLKLARLLGPSFAEILSGWKSSKTSEENISIDSSEIDLSKVGSAIQMLFDKMDEDEMLDLILELFSSTRIDGKELTNEEFDLIFAGKTVTVYKVIGFVLEVNFGSFFGKGGIGIAMKHLSKTQ